MLMRSLSVDHPPIRFNCLCRGIVDTPMSRADLGRPHGFAGSSLPVLQPGQVASHAVFLASPVSAPINGTSIVSDLGYIARAALPPLDSPSTECTAAAMSGVETVPSDAPAQAMFCSVEAEVTLPHWRYSRGDWPYILRKTREKCAASVNPHRFATSVTDLS